MRSVARVLVSVVLGMLLGAAPAVASGDAGFATPSASAAVLAQTPTPEGTPPPAPSLEPEQSRDDLSEQQRYVIGGIGAVVILLVLVLRRARGKAPLGVRWRKR